MCKDGTLIPEKICDNGKWIDTGARCPEPDNGDGDNGDGDNGDGDNGNGDNGNGDNGNGDGIEVSISDEIFAQHRSCSLRLRPNAIYLVDALAAEITDNFSVKLSTIGLREKYESATTEQERTECVMKGRNAHREVIESTSSGRKTPAKIDGRLEGKADLRGDLVVFRQPATFVKHPTASFRSLERIDGEDLLNQIVKGIPKPTIRIWARAAKTASITRSEIEARLAGKVRLSLAITHRLLDVLADLAKEQLRQRKVFMLPRIGTVRIMGATQGKVRHSKPMSRPDIVASLLKYLERGEPEPEEQVLQLSRSAVNEFLDELSQLVSEELRKHGGALRLPRLGTFRSGKHKPRFFQAKALGVSEKMVFESVVDYSTGGEAPT